MVNAKELMDKQQEYYKLKQDFIQEVLKKIGHDRIRKCEFQTSLELVINSEEYLTQEELNFILDKGFILTRLSEYSPKYVFSIYKGDVDVIIK